MCLSSIIGALYKSGGSVQLTNNVLLNLNSFKVWRFVILQSCHPQINVLLCLLCFYIHWEKSSLLILTVLALPCNHFSVQAGSQLGFKSNLLMWIHKRLCRFDGPLIVSCSIGVSVLDYGLLIIKFTKPKPQFLHQLNRAL